MNAISEPAVEGVLAADWCGATGIPLAEACVDQFVLSENRHLPLDGMSPLHLERWTLYAGAQARVLPMRDRAGRLFGVFVGIGVDPDGRLVDGGTFAAFDLAEAEALAALERLLAYSAGRFVALLDHGPVMRVWFDAVAHMTTLYNRRLRRVGSSVALCLDRPVRANPMFDPDAIARGTASGDTEPNYILGHSQDRDVRFALPNHVLELRDFSLRRIWPLPDSFPPARPEEYRDLAGQMVARLRQTLMALVEAHDCIMPVSGGTDSRKLFACLTGAHDKVKMYFAFEHNKYAKLDALCGEYITGLLGQPFRRIGEKDGSPAQTVAEARRATRLFLMRGSGVAAPPMEYRMGLPVATPAGHLHLRGNVMDLTRSIWWRSFAGRDKKVEIGLRDEIASLFLNATPSRERVEKWAHDYYAWRHGLPENARALVYDFIFLELFLHVSSAKYYAYDRNFYINPFADRRLIELTLRFPVDWRFDNHLNELFLELAEPRLAGQPGRGTVRRMIKRGQFVPAP